MIEQLRVFAGWFAADAWPSMTCPECGEATLRADTPVEYESVASKGHRDHEAWEPDWIRGFFTVPLHCQNASCREMAVAVGDYRVEEIYDRYSGQAFRSSYRLRSCVPALPIVETPSGCPDPVKEALTQAAQVIWMDPGAAGNRLRFAIERVLDDRNVAKTILTKGKRVRLTLHARIDLLRAKNKAAADVLEAVKWIGNQASHEDSVKIEGALEAAKILEHALVLLYDRSPDEIQRRVRKINKDKRLRP